MFLALLKAPSSRILPWMQQRIQIDSHVDTLHTVFRENTINLMAKVSHKQSSANGTLLKAPTGIQGLDEITGGGFPRGRPR